METPEKFMLRMGMEQLAAFKDFQDREQGGMTIRDFDVWLGGFISGISHYYNEKAKGKMTEKKFADNLTKIAMKISKGKIAKGLGITGTAKEQVVILNTAKK